MHDQNRRGEQPSTSTPESLQAGQEHSRGKVANTGDAGILQSIQVLMHQDPVRARALLADACHLLADHSLTQAEALHDSLTSDLVQHDTQKLPGVDFISELPLEAAHVIIAQLAIRGEIELLFQMTRVSPAWRDVICIASAWKLIAKSIAAPIWPVKDNFDAAFETNEDLFNLVRCIYRQLHAILVDADETSRPLYKALSSQSKHHMLKAYWSILTNNCHLFQVHLTELSDVLLTRSLTIATLYGQLPPFEGDVLHRLLWIATLYGNPAMLDVIFAYFPADLVQNIDRQNPLDQLFSGVINHSPWRENARMALTLPRVWPLQSIASDNAIALPDSIKAPSNLLIHMDGVKFDLHSIPPIGLALLSGNQAITALLLQKRASLFSSFGEFMSRPCWELIFLPFDRSNPEFVEHMLAQIAGWHAQALEDQENVGNNIPWRPDIKAIDIMSLIEFTASHPDPRYLSIALQYHTKLPGYDQTQPLMLHTFIVKFSDEKLRVYLQYMQPSEDDIHQSIMNILTDRSLGRLDDPERSDDIEKTGTLIDHLDISNVHTNLLNALASRGFITHIESLLEAIYSAPIGSRRYDTSDAIRQALESDNSEYIDCLLPYLKHVALELRPIYSAIPGITSCMEPRYVRRWVNLMKLQQHLDTVEVINPEDPLILIDLMASKFYESNFYHLFGKFYVDNCAIFQSDNMTIRDSLIITLMDIAVTDTAADASRQRADNLPELLNALETQPHGHVSCEQLVNAFGVSHHHDFFKEVIGSNTFVRCFITSFSQVVRRNHTMTDETFLAFRDSLNRLEQQQIAELRSLFIKLLQSKDEHSAAEQYDRVLQYYEALKPLEEVEDKSSTFAL